LKFIEFSFPKDIPETENQFYKDASEDNQNEIIRKEDLDR